MKDENHESQYRAFYPNEVIEATFQEMKTLIKYANLSGYYPKIIGGWAVWAYTQGLGSRDIDISFPNQASIDRFLIPFYRANGYEEVGFLFSKRYQKRISVDGREEAFYVDAASYERRNFFKEEPEKQYEIAWPLLEKYSELWDLEDLTAYIPTKELLLLTKVKAYRDRNYDLAHTEAKGLEVVYLQSKIWKDAQDIKALTKLEIDIQWLGKIIREAGLEAMESRIWETLREVGTLEPGPC